MSRVATGDCCASSPSGSGSSGTPVLSQPERQCSDRSETSTAQSPPSLARHRRADERREMFSVAVKGTDAAGDRILLDSSWHSASGVYKWSI